MVIERLFADRVLDNLRSAQGIVRTLKNKYKSSRLEAACKRAILYDNPRYTTIKSILFAPQHGQISVGRSVIRNDNPK